MKRAQTPTTGAIVSLAVAALLVAGGCTPMDDGSRDLTFSGDSSFQGAHGGQGIQVAVVRASDGAVVASESGTVSDTTDPSFSFTFPGVLEDGESYEVHYWIDSNFGGGSMGACDPKDQDHQWSVPLGSVEGDVSHTAEHQPAATTDVCGTFS